MIQNTHPNLLWIFVDQLRFHSLGCHGDENISTPNLDKLISESTDFINTISPCPVCTPARGCVMTGHYGNTTGIKYLGDLLLPSQRTIADEFNESGYITSYVGKWHLSSSQNPYGHNEGAEFWVHPLLRGGFQDWFGFELSNHFWKTRYSTDDSMWPPKLLNGYQTDALTTLSLDYLKTIETEGEEKPWFHVLSLETPHHGSDENNVSSVTVGEFTHTRHPAPAEYEKRFQPEKIKLRENVPLEYKEVAQSQQAQYGAMIENLDDNIGRLINWLDSGSFAENTIVVFFSDHGEMGGSHGYFQKCNPYAESLKIPMVIRMPKGSRVYRKVKTPASLVDLLPTCASLCGLSLKSKTQGVDLSGIITGKDSFIHREAVLSQWFGNPRYDPTVFHGLQWRAVQTENYTYWVDSKRQAWLFDNNTDPFQMKNLALWKEYNSLVNEHHNLLITTMQHATENIPDWITTDRKEKQ